jgi:hypothetical protein
MPYRKGEHKEPKALKEARRHLDYINWVEGWS